MVGLARTSGLFGGTLSFDPLDITADKHQDWTLDGMGNFAEFDDNGDTQTRKPARPTRPTRSFVLDHLYYLYSGDTNRY
jgi:hypothetical protein